MHKMNTFKKIAAVVLSLTLVIAVAGCGKKKKEAEEITKLVNDYMGYVVTSDGSAGAALVTGGEDVITPVSADFDKSQMAVYEAVLSNLSYEVTEANSESKDGKGTAELTLKVPVVSVDGCQSVDEVVASISDDNVDEKKVTVNLIYESEKFLINADSAREISSIISDTVTANDYAFLLNADEVVNEYITLMASGDVVNAYKLYTEYGSSYTQDEKDSILANVAHTYYDGMEYEVSAVSEDDKEAVVKVSGQTYDIDAAIKSLYEDDNAVAIMAETMYLEGHDTTYESVDNALLSLMSDIVIDSMTQGDKADFEMEITLKRDESGAYKIVSPDELIPEISWNLSKISDDKRTELMKTALTGLLDSGKITQEEYDDIYYATFGEDEVLQSLDAYINELIANDLAASGVSGIVADSYYGGLNYEVNVGDVSSDGATVTIVGTVPDIPGAIADATSNGTLVSILTQAAYAALNSGSIGAGQDVAQSLLMQAFIESANNRPGIPFESNVRIVIKSNGDMYIEGAQDIFPDMPSSFNVDDLDRGMVASAAQQALGNLLASGAITQEEYEDYCSRIGSYV